MNIPIRFDLHINAQKIIDAIKAGLDPHRANKGGEPRSVWWQRVQHAQSGGELMDIYEAPLRGSHLSVWVLGVEYNLDENAVRRAIQILAEKYPKSFGDMLFGYYSQGAADRFVQCALFGEVRHA